MKRIALFGMLILLAFIVANFSSQTESPTNRDLHSINIWGKVTTFQGEVDEIENISISGQYEDIMVYAKPITPDTDPSNDRTPVKLMDIKTLTPIIEKGKNPVAYVYKNKEYLEIAITWKQRKGGKKGKEQRFIIERDKRLICYLTDLKQKKDFALEAIKKLEIKGCDKSHNKEEYNKIKELYDKTKNAVERIDKVELKEEINNNLNELYQAFNTNC